MCFLSLVSLLSRCVLLLLCGSASPAGWTCAAWWRSGSPVLLPPLVRRRWGVGLLPAHRKVRAAPGTNHSGSRTPVSRSRDGSLHPVTICWRRGQTARELNLQSRTGHLPWEPFPVLTHQPSVVAPEGPLPRDSQSESHCPPTGGRSCSGGTGSTSGPAIYFLVDPECLAHSGVFTCAFVGVRDGSTCCHSTSQSGAEGGGGGGSLQRGSAEPGSLFPATGAGVGRGPA